MNTTTTQPNTTKQFVVRFFLGVTYITPGAQDALEESNQSPQVFLDRHRSGDWGDMSEGDKAENELSVQEGFRIFSAYHTTKGEKIWVITEADRSSTTILLPSEY